MDITTDLRVDLIRRVEAQHMVSSESIEYGHRPEHWRCKCGTAFEGAGAIELGRRHVASEILAALDKAGVMA